MKKKELPKNIAVRKRIRTIFFLLRFTARLHFYAYRLLGGLVCKA